MVIISIPTLGCVTLLALGEESWKRSAPLVSSAVSLAYFLPKLSLECLSLLIVSQLDTGFELFLTNAVMTGLPCLLW